MLFRTLELCLPIQQFVCKADRNACSMRHRRINLLLICSTRFGTKQNHGGTRFATTRNHINSYMWCWKLQPQKIVVVLDLQPHILISSVISSKEWNVIIGWFNSKSNPHLNRGSETTQRPDKVTMTQSITESKVTLSIYQRRNKIKYCGAWRDLGSEVTTVWSHLLYKGTKIGSI